MSRRAAAVLATTVLLAATMTAASANPGGPDQVLEHPARGEAAIEALGDRLPAVAADNGMSPGEFRQALRADGDRWVGRSGRVMYVDEGLHLDADQQAGAAATTQAAPFAYDQTFLLHSNPGANRVIYLDFDGHVVSGTAWNGGGAPSTIVARAFDTDNDPSTFTNAEMDVVQDVWRRVAEDYAPFDVDVTTEDPGIDAIRRSGSGDQQFGTRLVVSDDNMNTVCGGGCGGVAYVGTYDLTSNHDYYQPAWVFTEGVGHGSKNIAEAASHEVGHNLGLSHDGTATTGYYQGHNGWAPIMGVGYYEPITQFSRGEYSGANQTQDDFAVIQSNGAPLHADDHGDTVGAATTLTGTTLSATGTISTRTDVDVFAFTAGAGPATITVDPAVLSPNLDVAITLRDAVGAVVAQADPTSARVNGDVASGMGATISATLAAGVHTLHVDGVGRGTASNGYTDYGSLGDYRVSGTVSDGGGGGGDAAPTAVATADVTSGPAPLTVNFDGSGSSDAEGPVTHAWDFGDGATSAAASPAHTYTTPGSWTATLTVTDSIGQSATDTVSIEVQDVPPPSEPPAAPTGTAVADGGDGTATVTWVDNADNETGFEIVREKQHKNGRWVSATTMTVGADVTSLVDEPGSGTFRYRVRAVNADGASSYDTWAQVDVTGGGGGGGGNGGGKGGGKPPKK